MPQLDAMLRALHDRAARELLLVEGARPAFRFPDGDRPVSQAALSRAQILTLVGELADSAEANRLSEGKPVRFEYRLVDGTGFICESSSEPPGFMVRVVPQAGGNQTACNPRAPSSSAPSTRERPLRPVPSGKPEVEAYLFAMVEWGASDLHLSSGETPMLRLHGDMVRLDGASPLSPEESARLLFPILPPRNKAEFEQTNDTDFAYEIAGLARFRCNVFADRKGIGAVFRTIPTRIPSAEDLGLPPAVLELCRLNKGLVLVTGPTGSGKSTTLAAIIDFINRTRSDHIITIEDPIEFVHTNQRCLVNQREVNTHTQGFKRALRAALREDPDIVLVGEMRDLETVAIAIETAETGHLVFGTLHTSTAPSTVDRVIDQFPADRQSQIRVMLSECLRGVISQTLLKKKEGGRVAALEILLGVPAVSNLIREGKTFQIPSIMQTGRKHGMILLNDALLDLVKRGVVTAEEAHFKAVDKLGLVSAFRSAAIELAAPATT